MTSESSPRPDGGPFWRGWWTGRRAAAVAGGVAALAVVATAVVGVPPGAPLAADLRRLMHPDGPAEILATGPDCLVDDILRRPGLTGEAATAVGLDSVLAGHRGRPAARPGGVPPRFRATHVVQCRLGPFRADGAGPATLERVTLDGDVEAFVRALTPPLLEAPTLFSGVQCAAIGIELPEIYLVDADGRAIRPSWPTGGRCDSVLPGATAAFAALKEVRVVPHPGVAAR